MAEPINPNKPVTPGRTDRVDPSEVTEPKPDDVQVPDTRAVHDEDSARGLDLSSNAAYFGNFIATNDALSISDDSAGTKFKFAAPITVGGLPINNDSVIPKQEEDGLPPGFKTLPPAPKPGEAGYKTIAEMLDAVKPSA